MQLFSSLRRKMSIVGNTKHELIQNGNERPKTKQNTRKQSVRGSKVSSRPMTTMDAADVVLSLRPHLRYSQATFVANQFLSRSRGHFGGIISRTHVVSLMAHFSRDQEYLYALHDRFLPRGKVQGGLTFHQFVKASSVWYNPSPIETMRLQFLIFDVDRDDVLSATDREDCCSYGMDPKLRTILLSFEGNIGFQQFLFACKSAGYNPPIKQYALGPLTHRALGSRDGDDEHSDHVGGGFSQGVVEIASGLGVSLNVSHDVNEEDVPLAVPYTEFLRSMELNSADVPTASVLE